MTEFFMDYGLFLAKTTTIIIGIIATIITVIALASRTKEEHQAHIEIKKLNDKFDETEQTLNSLLLTEKEQKTLSKR